MEAGDEKIIEVELVEGGGLELMVSSDDEIDPLGFRLEVRTAGTSGWKKHSTYIPTEDGQYQVGRINTAGTHYKSWKPLPVGESRRGYLTTTGNELEYREPTALLSVEP